ncbi:MAG: RNA methyltransferase [Bacteroidota bacterium]
MNWPKEFTDRVKNDLGSTGEDLIHALNEPPPVSIRFNPFKTKKWPENFEGVKWNSNGIYLPKRPLFTLDPYFHAGAYYVQEASSMFLEEAIKQTIDLQHPLKVLDLAAAPGGKTTLLAGMLSSESLLLANEVIKSRYKILRQNVAKWGLPNVYTSNHDASGLTNLSGFFDVVIIDAPCSGEGMFRKDPQSAKEWSTENVKLCASRQKKILADSMNLLAEEGVLIYSTCTYNAEENDMNAKWLHKSFPLEPIKLSLPEEWNITPGEYGYQFYPHKTKGEGFYLAAFKKTVGSNFRFKLPKKRSDNWVKLSSRAQEPLNRWIKNDKAYSAYSRKDGQLQIVLSAHDRWSTILEHAIPRIDLGTPIGKLKQNKLVPAHDWALSIAANKNRIPTYNVDLTGALHYLKKETLHWDDIPMGWVRIDYKGLGLGWIKKLSNRINNYLPNNARIIMDLPEEIPIPFLDQ